jgi:AraC-like DNA-binding protein
MASFELISPDGEDINFVSALPDTAPSLILAGSQPLFAQCSFGNMGFYHFQGDGYSIWQSFYDIHRSARVIGRSGDPFLEFTAMYENSFAIDWKGVTAGKLPVKQIELYYAPYVENRAEFRAGQYMTLDVHIQPSMLEPYAKEFPLLDQFMGSVYKAQPAKLFSSPQFASPRIDGVLREIMQYSYLDSLAPRYFDSYVHILLVLLLERISGLRSAPVLSTAHVALALEAKRLLTVDYQASLTIAQLCRKLGSNPYLLKTVFKSVHGTSIGKYKKAAFMGYARQLLLDTGQSLEDISILLGYNSQQSFNTAFRNHFGYTPGRIRRGRG